MKKKAQKEEAPVIPKETAAPPKAPEEVQKTATTDAVTTNEAGNS